MSVGVSCRHRRLFKALYCAEFSIEDEAHRHYTLTPKLPPVIFDRSVPHAFLNPSCSLPLQRCDVCREVGATVGCCASWCTANYHFQCARKAKCLFLQNKEVYCEQHTSLAEGKVQHLMVTIFLPFLVTSLPERLLIAIEL